MVATHHVRTYHACLYRTTLQVGIWRDGQALELPVRVNVPQRLVPYHSHDVKPK
jgi:hypothetical protein